MEDYIYIKKEEDNFSSTIKNEEGIDYQPKRIKRPFSTVSTNIDIGRNTTQMTKGLASIVSQYAETEQFDKANLTSTEEMNNAIREMENYVYRMHKEGEVTTNIFNYLNGVIEVTRKWNERITQQQQHMKDYVLNSINYNKELHTLYNEVTKKQNLYGRQKRDPASVFNTVQPEIDYMTLNNDNGAILSFL